MDVEKGLDEKDINFVANESDGGDTKGGEESIEEIKNKVFQELETKGVLSGFGLKELTGQRVGGLLGTIDSALGALEQSADQSKSDKSDHRLDHIFNRLESSLNNLTHNIIKQSEENEKWAQFENNFIDVGDSTPGMKLFYAKRMISVLNHIESMVGKLHEVGGKFRDGWKMEDEYAISEERIKKLKEVEKRFQERLDVLADQVKKSEGIDAEYAKWLKTSNPFKIGEIDTSYEDMMLKLNPKEEK